MQREMNNSRDTHISMCGEDPPGLELEGEVDRI